MGAHLNVKINCAGLDKTPEVAALEAKAAEIEALAVDKERAILEIVGSKI
jgi:hypothetical protein